MFCYLLVGGWGVVEQFAESIYVVKNFKLFLACIVFCLFSFLLYYVSVEFLEGENISLHQIIRKVDLVFLHSQN